MMDIIFLKNARMGGKGNHRLFKNFIILPLLLSQIEDYFISLQLK